MVSSINQNKEVFRRLLWKSSSHHDLNRGRNQVDHGDEILHVSVSPGSGPRCQEQAIEPFEPRIGVQGMSTMKDSRKMPLKAGQCAAHGFQKGAVGRVFGGMLEKMGDAPLGGLLRFGPPSPTQKFFDTAGLGGGSEALLDEILESVLLIFRAYYLGVLEQGPTGCSPAAWTA